MASKWLLILDQPVNQTAQDTKQAQGMHVMVVEV